MSVKIYTAWRCSLENLPEFHALLHEHMMDSIIKWVRVFMPNIKYELVAKGIEYIKNHDPWAKDKTLEDIRICFDEWIRLKIILLLAYRDSTKPEVGAFDLDCGFNVYISKGHAYILPFGKRCAYDDFAIPSFAEQYGFWDNTDKPEEVSEEEWKKREDEWGKILDNMDNLRLQHHVLNLSNNFNMGTNVFSFLKKAVPSRGDTLSYLFFMDYWDRNMGINEVLMKEVS